MLYVRDKLVLSRSTLRWILASLLLILFIFLFRNILCGYRILVHEEPIEVGTILPSLEDPVSKETHLENNANSLHFDFRINPVNLCATMNPPNSVEYQRNPELKLLILVASEGDHFQERRAIRNTWGSVAKRPLGTMRLGFILSNEFQIYAHKKNKTIDNLIHRESSEFRDIIQTVFVDSLHNLSNKRILAFKWVARMCPHALYFLKTEEGAFVNMRTIADILNKQPYSSEDRFIVGHIEGIRPSQMDFYLTRDDYPEDNDFPPFASGSYVMTIPTAIDLFGATEEVERSYSDDDAFLTGDCAKRINVSLIHEPSFIVDEPPMPPSWDTYSTLAIAHSIAPTALEQVWKDLTKSVPNATYYFESAINATGRFRRKKNA